VKLKKIYLIPFLLVFFSTIVFADNIYDYNVTKLVPLGDYLTIKGNFFDSSGASYQTKCSSVILTSDGNYFVEDRVDDTFTAETGFFSQTYLVLEPTLKRDKNYFVFTTCGDTNALAPFKVIQRESIEQTLFYEWLFVTSPENLIPLFYWVVVFLASFGIIIGVWFMWSRS
jgi:hypothetical protein